MTEFIKEIKKNKKNLFFYSLYGVFVLHGLVMLYQIGCIFYAWGLLDIRTVDLDTFKNAIPESYMFLQEVLVLLQFVVLYERLRDDSWEEGKLYRLFGLLMLLLFIQIYIIAKYHDIPSSVGLRVLFLHHNRYP